MFIIHIYFLPFSVLRKQHSTPQTDGRMPAKTPFLIFCAGDGSIHHIGQRSGLNRAQQGNIKKALKEECQNFTFVGDELSPDDGTDSDDVLGCQWPVVILILDEPKYLQREVVDVLCRATTKVEVHIRFPHPNCPLLQKRVQKLEYLDFLRSATTMEFDPPLNL